MTKTTARLVGSEKRRPAAGEDPKAETCHHTDPDTNWVRRFAEAVKAESRRLLGFTDAALERRAPRHGLWLIVFATLLVGHVRLLWGQLAGNVPPTVYAVSLATFALVLFVTSCSQIASGRRFKKWVEFVWALGKMALTVYGIVLLLWIHVWLMASLGGGPRYNGDMTANAGGGAAEAYDIAVLATFIFAAAVWFVPRFLRIPDVIFDVMLEGVAPRDKKKHTPNRPAPEGSKAVVHASPAPESDEAP